MGKEQNKGPAPLTPSSCSVPVEAYVGKAVPAATIQAATTKRGKVLGVGGFGKVFAGELPGLAGSSSSKVAIKVATSGGVPALIHEATIMRLAAAHPNVASILGSCWEEDHEALVTEYCSGGDLDHYIGCFTQQQQQKQQQPPRVAPPAAAASKAAAAASSPATISSSRPEVARAPKVRQLGWVERLKVTYQVASALAFMHQGCGVGQQVLHLDIKPGNVLLDAAGNAKLIDFGIARVVAATAAAAAPASAHAAAPASGANGHSSHHHNHQPPQQQHHAHLHGAHGSSRPGSARDHHHPAAGAAAGHKCPASAAEAKLAALAARGVGQGQVLQDQGWAGTPDYLDPLYEQLGQLCDRSDVYSLGLIMCQLLLDNSEPQDAHHILAHAARQKALHLPKGLEAWPADSAGVYAVLALSCCSMQREARPTSQQLLAALLPLVRAAGIIGGMEADGAAAGGQLCEGGWEFMAAVQAPAYVPVQATAASSSSKASPRPPHPQQVPPVAAPAPGQLVRGAQAPAPTHSALACKGAWGKQAPAAAAHGIPAGAPAAEAWPSLGGSKPAAPAGHHGPAPASSACSSSTKALHKPEAHAYMGQAPGAAAGQAGQQGDRSWVAASRGVVLSMQLVVQAGGQVTGQLMLPSATGGTGAVTAAGTRQSSVSSNVGSKSGNTATFVTLSIDEGSYDASSGQIRFSAGPNPAAVAAAQAAMKALGATPAVQASSAAAAGGAGYGRAPSGVTRVSPGPSLKFLGTYQQGVLQGSWELCTPAAGSSSSSVWRVTSSYLWAAYAPPVGLSKPVEAEQASPTAAQAGVYNQQAAAVPAASPFAMAGTGAAGMLPQVEALTPEVVSAAVAAAVTAAEQQLLRRLSSSCARQHSLRADSGRQHSLNMVQPL